MRFRSSGMLRRLDWQLLTTFRDNLSGPIFKEQATQDRPLCMGPDIMSQNVGK